MCHSSVLTWAASLPPSVSKGRTVLEVGSYDVNGSVRPALEAHGPTSYLGVDQSAGPGVDEVADVTELPGRYPDGFGLVVSTEMLEHVRDWREAMQALVELVAPGGLLALTTRGPGFPYHAFPEDHWRYPVPVMDAILRSAGLTVRSCEEDPEAPGVFAVAFKPKKWTAPTSWFDGIEVPRV
jgi:SAM-dependent methyltransferase